MANIFKRKYMVLAPHCQYLDIRCLTKRQVEKLINEGFEVIRF